VAWLAKAARQVPEARAVRPAQAPAEALVLQAKPAARARVATPERVDRQARVVMAASHAMPRLRLPVAMQEAAQERRFRL
jgi:hypothetical protein